MGARARFHHDYAAATYSWLSYWQPTVPIPLQVLKSVRRTAQHHSPPGEALGQQAPAPTSPGACRSEASRNAPAAADQTEYDSGGSGPRATVIVTANTDNSTPVASATARSRTPTKRPTASATSSTVAAHPAAGTHAAGRNQRSWPVWARNWANPPQPTPGVPGGPHRPNRSATADRNPAARASRRKTADKAVDQTRSDIAYFPSFAGSGTTSAFASRACSSTASTRVRAFSLGFRETACNTIAGS